MERNLQDVTFVVVDLETTGGAPFGGSEITEFGAVKVRGGEVIGEFSTFVRTDRAIPQFIVEMTGITDEMIANSPASMWFFLNLSNGPGRMKKQF